MAGKQSKDTDAQLKTGVYHSGEGDNGDGRKRSHFVYFIILQSNL